MVAIAETDSGYRATLSIRPVIDDVRVASAWLDKVCTERGVSALDVLRLDMCLNEVLANVIFHGGVEAAQDSVDLALKITHGEAELLITDAGAEFNPLEADEKPFPDSLEEATPGGLGIVMMKGYLDGLDYEYREGRNHLKLIVRWQ